MICHSTGKNFVCKTLPGGLSENSSLIFPMSTFCGLPFGVSHSVFNEDAEAIPVSLSVGQVCCPECASNAV